MSSGSPLSSAAHGEYATARVVVLELLTSVVHLECRRTDVRRTQLLDSVRRAETVAVVARLSTTHPAQSTPNDEVLQQKALGLFGLLCKACPALSVEVVAANTAEGMSHAPSS